MKNNDSTPQSAFNRRVRRHVNGRVREYYAVTAPEMEKRCQQELNDLDHSRDMTEMEPGGVTFTGRFIDCMQANLYLRTATRVLMRISTFSATNHRQLKRKIEGIPWELFLPSCAKPEVKSRSIQSRLYHSEAIREGVVAGITSRMGGPFYNEGQTMPQTLFIRVINDRFTVSLDSSGDPLYKRGLKRGMARAPIRETLAAAILGVSGYDPKHPLVDPMCGSGTFSLEACLMAKRIAPGLFRCFSFMEWPAYRASQWAFEKQNAEAGILNLDQPTIFASDVDAVACKQLEATIAAQNLADAITVRQQSFFDCQGRLYGNIPGLIVINPPYGRRLGSSRQAHDLFNDICGHLVHSFKGWSVALISPRPEFARHLPFPARRLPLLHGGLKLTLIIGRIK